MIFFRGVDANRRIPRDTGPVLNVYKRTHHWFGKNRALVSIELHTVAPKRMIKCCQPVNGGVDDLDTDLLGH